jgi:hypothetical protein
LLSIEQAPVHGLVNAGTFGRNDLPGGGGSLRGLSINTTRNIFATDGKISRCNIGLVSTVEFLCQLIGAGLKTKVVIGRSADGIGHLLA